MVIFCDFDGTISNVDLLDIVIEQYYGKEQQSLFEKQLLDGEIEHNHFLKNTFEKMNYNIEDMIKIIENKLENKVIDQYFKLFYEKCKINNIDFYVISGGFKQIIKHFLPYVDEKYIYANDFFNLSTKKLDKNQIINSLKKDNEKSLYFGDGISDFHVINNVDDLYVKKNSILQSFCESKKANYKVFDSFSEILKIFNTQYHLKLLSPGIVRSNSLVLDELKYQHTFMHRDEQFKILYQCIDNNIKNVVCNNPNNYSTLLVTGSGTTSMDEVINCIVNHGKTLFVCNGMFGERWLNIGEFYNSKNVFKLRKKWGQVLNIDEIKNYVLDNDIKYIVIVHCDTSVGILNPIQDISEAIKDTNCSIIVDAVSSFGVVPINMEKSNISILVTNPNKSIASHMGLGIIIGLNSFLESFQEKLCGSYSLNLKRHYNMASKKETCNSVSISSMNALNCSLYVNYNTKDKIEYMYNNYKYMFNYVYEELKKLNKKTLIEKNISCPAIITILEEDSNNIIEKLKDNNFIVYPCKGELNNKGYQISFYGDDANIENLESLINIIKLIS